MNSFSVVDAIKFGFDKSIKKIFFFLMTHIVFYILMFGGFFLGMLVSILFLLPARNMILQFIALFQSLGAGVEVKVVGAKVATLIADAPSVFIWIVLGFFVYFMVLSFFGVMLTLGNLKIYLDVHDKGHSSLGNFFVRPLYVFRAFLAEFLIVLMVAAGPLFALSLAEINFWLFVGVLIPMIFMSIYFGFKFFFSIFFIIDKGLSAIEAMRASWRLEGAPIKLILFILAFCVVVILFSLPVGLFALLPSSSIVDVFRVLFNIFVNYIFITASLMGYVYMYRRLSATQA